MMKHILTLALMMTLSGLAQAQSIYAQYRDVAIKAGVKPAAYDKVARYYAKNYNQLGNKKYISFIDFGYASTEERLFVLNLTTGKISKFLVTHGKNSGANYATSFSNVPESEKSSLGLYIIQDEYTGKHGASLKLIGLEKGLDPAGNIIPDNQIDGIKNGKNSNAEARKIVMHKADYATETAIENNNGVRLGRSQGCPAVSPEDWKVLKPALKGGSILLIYKVKEAKNNSTKN